MGTEHGAVRSGSELRILVVGGGVAGLTLAALLRQRGIVPEVVEKAHGYGGVGYVLGLWPAGAGILNGLGLRNAYFAASSPFRTYRIVNGKGHTLQEYDLSIVEERYGAGRLLTRADFIDVLRRAVGDLPIRMGVTVDRLSQEEHAVNVVFTDGTAGRYDLVVGCDGLRSRVRELAFGAVPLTYFGLHGWGFWSNPDLAKKDEVIEYWGAGRFLGLYPSPGHLGCFLAVPAKEGEPDPASERIERIRREFSPLGGDAPQVLSDLGDPEHMWHDDFYDLELESWYQGRVVLVGDAAHAILPTGGVGASMAMESAAVLAEELSRTDSQHIELALRKYSARRRRRVDHLRDQSRTMGRFSVVKSRFLSLLRDEAISFLPEREFLHFWDDLLGAPI